jgi:hypothetical protein
MRLKLKYSVTKQVSHSCLKDGESFLVYFNGIVGKWSSFLSIVW